MTAVAAPPVITPADRLGLTLCLAVIGHAIIILGVTFAPEDVLEPRFDTMEIILVRQQSSDVPEEAQLLAQASLEGGGEAAVPITPATPLPPPFPDLQAEVTATEPMPAPPPQARADVIVEHVPDKTTAKPEAPLAAETQQPEPQAAQPADPEPVEPPQPSMEAVPAVPPTRPLPSATALLANSFKIASLSAEIKQKLEAKAQRPKRKFISASTREYRYAAYMEAWRAKVERVGNLNYPDEARKRQLSGSLILDVALNPDGGVNEITIRRSSGHKVLDDAAVRIVHLAAPFAPFPDDIRRETDILHITRTWQFLNKGGFR